MKVYPHRLRLFGPHDPEHHDVEHGEQDPDEGTWSDDPDPNLAGPHILYDGPADVQDKGEVLARDEAGQPTLVSNAVAYLGLKNRAKRFKPDMLVEITWEDGTIAQAMVLMPRRLDNTVHLRRIY